MLIEDLLKWLSLAIVSCCGFFSLPCFAAIHKLEGIAVYHQDINNSSTYKDKLSADLTRYLNADNLWNALREDFTLPRYDDNPMVREKIYWYMNNQDYLLRAASRAAPYLYYIFQQVKARHLPAELVLLPIVESGYNPFAISNMGASGIWQMMPDTASGFGVKNDWWYDGRRDVIASTHAALDYLSYLQTFFNGNWLYAIAAYNTGEGNLLAAIKRNMRQGRTTDFWSLPVAQQTRDYVPSILALATIISHPNEYPVYLPPVRNAPYLAEIDVGQQISLEHAAKLAGITYATLMRLNPGFNRLTTSTKGPYKLILPIESVERFSHNLAQSQHLHGNLWVHYKVQPGDSLISIAKKFNSSPLALQKINDLKNNFVRAGNDILIPKNGDLGARIIESLAGKQNSRNLKLFSAYPFKSSPPSIKSKPIPSKYTIKSGDTIYMVRPKDTLASIASRFKLTKDAILNANRLAKLNVKPGQQLILPTHKTAFNTDQITNGKKMQAGDTIYQVRHGDTIEKIAKKFKTSPAAIRLFNFVNNQTLNEGQNLVIPTHLNG